MSKLVSLADVITSPEMMKVIDKMKKEREASPARHERKFNMDLMNYSMEINFHCQQIGSITFELLNNRDAYSSDETDEMFEIRKTSIFELARVQNLYDAKVSELDLEIQNEDAQKVS